MKLYKVYTFEQFTLQIRYLNKANLKQELSGNLNILTIINKYMEKEMF